MTSMLKATSRPSSDAGERADHARGRALDHEDPHHRARRRAERAQDGDVGALVGDRHDERRDEVERGDRDDQRQDDEHQALLDLHRGEPVAVGAGPVAHDDVRAEALRELGADPRRAVEVLQAQLDAGRPVDAKQLGGVLERDQREAAVVLVVAGVEGADDGERAAGAARSPAGVTWPPGSDDVTLSPSRTPSERASSPPRTTLQAPGTRRASVVSLSLAARSVTVASPAATMPRTIDAAHVVAARDQRLRGDERRRADHLRVAPRLRSRSRRQSGERRAAGVAHLDVRDHRQHPVAHFLLEAVHHRQHDDQRGDAERDAEHRHAGDERDEAVPAPGPAGSRVAPADLQFVGPVHAGAMLPDRPRRLAPRGAPIIAACTCSFRSLPIARRPASTCCATWRCRTSSACSRCSRRAGRDDGDAGSFSPPHERALAAALGLARRRRPAAVRRARRRRRRHRHRRPGLGAADAVRTGSSAATT